MTDIQSGRPPGKGLNMTRAFHRDLPRRLIERLNELYQDPDSWWHRLVDYRDKDSKADHQPFFAVRNGYLSVYTNGGSLLKIKLSRGNVSCQIHEEYVIQRREANPYVRLDSDAEHRIRTIRTPEELVDRYESVRSRIGLFMGEERQGVCGIACRVPCVIDIEATAGPAASESRLTDLEARSRDAMDLVAVSPDGQLWCFEAKLLKSQELRGSDGLPRVVEQLNRYSERMLRNRRDELVEAYRNVASIYRQLDGRAFEVRREAYGRIDGVRGDPVLILFGYDRGQQQGKLRLQG